MVKNIQNQAIKKIKIPSILALKKSGHYNIHKKSVFLKKKILDCRIGIKKGFDLENFDCCRKNKRRRKSTFWCLAES